VFLLERDDGHKENRKPHARRSADNGRVMTLGTDMGGAIDDFELISKTKKERDED